MLFGQPAEAVTSFKVKHMIGAIKYYIHKRNLYNEFIRIDVIEVYLNDNNIKINHIKKAIE